MTARRGPVRPEELDGLFGTVGKAEPVGLAVSGGCDSTALMVLFAEWLAQRGDLPQRHTVLTIDHRLRPQSSGEAEAVARRAGALGFRQATLAWEGEKPATGLQAAARSARYGLLRAYAGRHGITRLLTGHTADDQGETLLMRLARGSGVDGLAAMAPDTLFCKRGQTDRARLSTRGEGRGGECGAIAPALRLMRPLLSLTRARLRATLEARGISWIEDPSNQSPAFERARLRGAWGQFAALGLTADNLALSALRLQRARAALERSVDDFCAKRVAIDPLGYIGIDAPALRQACPEIAVRLLNRVVAGAGGAMKRPALSKLEALAAGLRTGERGSWTLARAKITATRERVLIERERGRTPPPSLALQPGRESLWDGRFLVRARTDLAQAIDVGGLGAEGLREAAQAVEIPPDVPRGALVTLPAFSREGRLLAVPNLGYWASLLLSAQLSANFAPDCCLLTTWEGDP